MNRFTNLVALVVSTVLLSTSAGLAEDGAVSVLTVRVPESGSYPQARTDSAGRIHLTYVKGDPMRADLFYVRSDDGGKTFSKALRVNSHPGSIVITGTVRGPHLALGKNDRVHVAWMGSDEARRHAGGRHLPMLYTRLNDAVDAFEPQRNVIQHHPGLDGGGSVAADREGNVYVAWHAPNGGEDEASRDVWVTRSRDDGITFDAETSALPEKVGVCGCCGMRIHAGADGKVFIAFRSAREKVHRDIHLLASDDYGKTFRVDAVDRWEIGTCAMSTASLAESSAGLLGVWETKERVRLARLPANSPAAPIVSIPGQDAPGKHPSVAVNSRGDTLVAWAIGTGWNKGGAVAWQTFDREGRAVPSLAGRRQGLPVWSVPAVVALRDGTFRIFF